MNDAHGVKGEGWYGVYLDGTLAVYDVYDKRKGIENIGDRGMRLNALERRPR